MGFWNRDVPLPLAALLVIGFAIASVRPTRVQRRMPLGLLAPLVCLVSSLAQRVAPFERVWLFLLPLYFAIAAAGSRASCDRPAARRVGFGGVLGLCRR